MTSTSSTTTFDQPADQPAARPVGRLPDGAAAAPSAGEPAPGRLPPVAAEVVAAAVESLTSRLRKKLDAAVEQYTAEPVVIGGDGIQVTCGEDAVVTLVPGKSGVIVEEGQARCSCLLAPRCLHRAAVLSACPVADPSAAASADPACSLPDGPATAAGTAGTVAGTGGLTAGQRTAVAGPTAVQVAAASGLWRAATAVLSGGVPAAGAVPQAELLRAAHTARLAGLPRAESAALRVVRGLRAARAQQDGHRLSDLVSALRELLLTAGRLTMGDTGPALTGGVRRAYEPGGSLRVYGVFREPVISATGYGGVVTYLVTDDGRWFSIADVRPGGPARARGAATATVAIGSATLNHAQLARGGLLITGATVSADGRLGAGGGVRATPLTGGSWATGPLAALFTRPLAEAAGSRLSGEAWDEQDTTDRAREPVGCDLMILGPAGDHVLARELRSPAAGDHVPARELRSPAAGSSAAGTGAALAPTPPEADGALGGSAGSQGGGVPSAAEAGGPVIRLVPADPHPDLAHVANLRRLASRPGLVVRVVGRVDPDRAATLRPLAVGPVPGADEATLRLPPEWHDRADLGYDRLQGAHLPPPEACAERPGAAEPEVDPVAQAPLWRVRRMVELAVSGGRRTVAEAARGSDSRGQETQLRRAGFTAAAELVGALAAEAGRRGRDVFGRLADSDPDRYAWAWLAASAHLAATERALVQASWGVPMND